MIPPPPQHVFLEVQMTCNLRCVQCDIWRLTNPADELSAEERQDVVRQVSAWDPAIRVVLGGGEAFNRRTMLYSVAEEARRRDVYVTISSNGTQITEADLERLPRSGVRCIVLSVDSDEEAVHDRIRGVPGTYKKVMDSIRRLVTARDRSQTDFTVLTSTILGAHNMGRIENMVRLFEDLGVDTTLFQPIQSNFARETAADWWRSSDLFPRDSALVDSAIDELIRLKGDGKRIFQSAAQFEDMRAYFRSPERLPEGLCASMDQQVMVDMRGDVRLCFNMERIGLRPVGNVRERTLRELWEDRAVGNVRDRMRGCVEGCGSMICHAR